MATIIKFTLYYDTLYDEKFKVATLKACPLFVDDELAAELHKYAYMPVSVKRNGKYVTAYVYYKDLVWIYTPQANYRQYKYSIKSKHPKHRCIRFNHNGDDCGNEVKRANITDADMDALSDAMAKLSINDD